jgi:hypothetical protein
MGNNVLCTKIRYVCISNKISSLNNLQITIKWYVTIGALLLHYFIVNNCVYQLIVAYIRRIKGWNNFDFTKNAKKNCIIIWVVMLM